MIKFKLTIIAIMLATIASPAFAKEIVVSYVEWSIPGQKIPSFVCDLSKGPEHNMQGTLRCYVNTSKEGKLKKEKKVFTYRDDYRSPISVAPALGPVSNALITMWESGAYACYIVFGCYNDKIMKLFEHCTKGGIETVDDGDNGILFLITDYAPYDPTDTTIYHWNVGKISKKKIPFDERLDEVKRLQSGHNKGNTANRWAIPAAR